MGAPVRCELLPNGRCFLSDGIYKQVDFERQAVSGAILLMQSRSGSFEPSQTVLNPELNVCRAHTPERHKGQTGLTGHFLGRKESLGKMPRQ